MLKHGKQYNQIIGGTLMTKYNLLILVVMTLIVAMVTFIHGLKINKRKIIVINARYTLFINLLDTLYFIVVVFSILVDMHKYSWSLQSFIIIGFIIALGLFLFVVYPIGLNIFNANEDVIYDSLESLLLKHSVNHEWKNSKIFIQNSKVFIKIWYSKSSNTCTLTLSDTKFPPIIVKVFEDLKNQLNNQRSDLKSTNGRTSIFLSVIAFIFGILLFILLLLIP